jgi:hypothetical protein
MRKLQLSLALVALCLLAVACSEDDPVKPAKFAVTIKVTDPAGQPVEHLRVGLVNDCPYFQDGGMAAKAAVVIPFRTVYPVAVRLTIENIDGEEIRVLLEGNFPSGQHQWIWDGRDGQGVHQPSGRYTAHLVALDIDTGDKIFEDQTDMFLAMLDSSRVPAGHTNQQGKLVLVDRKLFPHLYNRSPMTATDENGVSLGTLNLTSLMRISLTDTVAGKSMGFKEDVLKGTVLELIWDPSQVAMSQDVISGMPGNSGAFPVAEEDPEPAIELGPIYPNPFN